MKDTIKNFLRRFALIGVVLVAGGPVDQVHDILWVGVPSTDFYSPDIYDADYTGILDRYSRKQTAIFVPECMSSVAIPSFNGFGGMIFKLVYEDRFLRYDL